MSRLFREVDRLMNTALSSRLRLGIISKKMTRERSHDRSFQSTALRENNGARPARLIDENRAIHEIRTIFQWKGSTIKSRAPVLCFSVGNCFNILRVSGLTEKDGAMLVRIRNVSPFCNGNNSILPRYISLSSHRRLVVRHLSHLIRKSCHVSRVPICRSGLETNIALLSDKRLDGSVSLTGGVSVKELWHLAVSERSAVEVSERFKRLLYFTFMPTSPLPEAVSFLLH